MPKRSAGLLMYRRPKAGVQVLLVHPGGPFWAKKDAGAWVIPKGEVEPGEEDLSAAKREFAEETGLQPGEPLISLGSIRHRSGKIVVAWAFEGDCDPTTIRSNTFSIEWPPKSGKMRAFPEIDRAAFFSLPEARKSMAMVEQPFLDALEKALT